MARAASHARSKKTAAKKKSSKTAARRKPSVRGKLATYNRKRDFTRTPEPGPERKSSRGGNSYLIQKHDARRLHYDFRLELDGVLLSWAIPKGPSLDPADKRLAVRTEDHPLEYGKFEGVIPEGEYGGGTVMLWDRGTWSWTKDPRTWLKRGQLEFELHGERLTGNWVLTRLRNRPGEKDGKENWLLIKRRDDVARDGEGEILVDHELTSVASERTMDEIAGQRKRVWSSKGGEQETKPTKKTPARKARAKPLKIEGGTNAKLPNFVAPQLATLVAHAPDGERWLHEIKFDGYRTEARIEDGEVRMLTRTGLDWTRKFQPIADALTELPVSSALLDGEIVVSDKGGATNFGDLQKALSEGQSDRLSYYLFDLLHLDGKDLRKLPLIERKDVLKKLLPERDDGLLRYSDHFTDRGPDFYRNACRLDLEGIVSKRADASYTSGRGKSWLKTKCTKRQEFVVGGWVASTKAGRDLRSLLVGYYDGKTFRYAGKIGTGFNARNTAQLLSLFKKNTADSSPFVELPKGVARGVHWLKPRIVIEAEFATWTHDRVIRHSSLEGIREDKEAKDVVLEVPIDAPADPDGDPPSDADRNAGAAKATLNSKATPKAKTETRAKAETAAEYGGIKLTHPDRVLWADVGVTKRQLADYYATVAPLMLPHIVNRPLSLVRCPDGAEAKCFFQRHMGQGLPDAVEGVKVRGDKNPYLAIYDEAGLFALIQFSTLEIHPWGAMADEPDRPDRIIMDFDPGEAVDWNSVKAAALECHQRLSDMGLESFLKTTGGKGLHVVIPIGRYHDWPEAKGFAQALATTMAGDNRIYITRMTKSERRGRIFIDYLRNDRTSTAVAPYSTRARAGAPIAMPLAWSEIRTLPRGTTIRSRPSSSGWVPNMPTRGPT